MTRESASVGPSDDSVAGAYQRDDPAPVTRLAALLGEHLIGPGGRCACGLFVADGDHARTAQHVAARLIASGVHLDDGLRAFAEWVRDVDPTTTTWNRAKQWATAALAAQPAPTPWRDFSRAYLTEHGSDPEAASPAPTLDRERLARALRVVLAHHTEGIGSLPPSGTDSSWTVYDLDPDVYTAAIAAAYEAEP